MAGAIQLNPGCCCTTGTPITFKGCGNLLLTNYQIDIYSFSGGTLLESVTTDSSGVANVVSTGVKWLQSRDGRFSGQSLTIATTTTLTVAGSLYVCLNCCAIPVKRTMTFTSTKFGTWTGDWVAAAGGFSVTGCGPCTYPTTIYPSLVSSAFPCTGVVAVNQNGSNCPISAFGITCLNIIYSGSVSMTCPPAFSWTGSAAITTPLPANTCGDRLVCSTYPWTDTMTATE